MTNNHRGGGIPPPSLLHSRSPSSLTTSFEKNSSTDPTVAALSKCQAQNAHSSQTITMAEASRPPAYFILHQHPASPHPLEKTTAPIQPWRHFPSAKPKAPTHDKQSPWQRRPASQPISFFIGLQPHHILWKKDSTDPTVAALSKCQAHHPSRRPLGVTPFRLLPS